MVAADRLRDAIADALALLHTAIDSGDNATRDAVLDEARDILSAALDDDVTTQVLDASARFAAALEE